MISAPAATVKQSEKTSLPEAVQAAANAALAAEKKEKEKAKEIKLASKTNLLANKKKMNNVLAMWKQRNKEGQAAHVALDDKEPSRSVVDKLNNSPSGIGFSLKAKPKSDFGNSKDMNLVAGYNSHGRETGGSQILDSDIKPRPVSNSLGTTVMGVIRGSGRGAVNTFHASSDAGGSISSDITASTSGLMNTETHTASTPFKTDLSSLGSYASPAVSGSAKRRFSEAPGQSQYRDRAAERRSLYGSSSSVPNDGLDTSKNTLSLLLTVTHCTVVSSFLDSFLEHNMSRTKERPYSVTFCDSHFSVMLSADSISSLVLLGRTWCGWTLFLEPMQLCIIGPMFSVLLVQDLY